MVGAESNGVAEEPRHGTELAAVGATATGLNRDDVEGAPHHPGALESLPRELGEVSDQIELIKVHPVPGDCRIIVERRLDLFAGGIDGGINFLQAPALGIGDDARPGLIGLAQGDGIGVPRAAIASEGLVRNFRDMRASHHYRNSFGANGVCHSVSLRHHPRHSANPGQLDALLSKVLDEFLFVQRLRVAIHEEHVVPGRGQRFEKKHPEMRHEVVGHFVVGIIEENIHRRLA